MKGKHQQYLKLFKRLLCNIYCCLLLLLSCLAYSLALKKMEVIYSSKTLGCVQTTWHYKPKTMLFAIIATAFQNDKDQDIQDITSVLPQSLTSFLNEKHFRYNYCSKFHHNDMELK
jgi:hypothetical protein